MYYKFIFIRIINETFQEVKKECPIKTEDTPSTSSIPEQKFKPEILIDDKETSEQLMKKLNKEFSLDEKELRELDGPEEVSSRFFQSGVFNVGSL